MAIGDYVDKHNGNPKPFVGTATANDFLDAFNAPTRLAILVNLIPALH